MSENVAIAEFEVTPEIAAIEETADALLGAALRKYLELYLDDGPMPAGDAYTAIAKAAGILMLRAGDQAEALIHAAAPDQPRLKAAGDLAIMTARAAGFRVRSFSGLLKTRVLPHIVAQLAEAARSPGQRFQL